MLLSSFDDILINEIFPNINDGKEANGRFGLLTSLAYKLSYRQLPSLTATGVFRGRA
jgi:hypothetical protein